jgi:ribosomal-protein-alanine N-acetyltransferase
MQIETERLLLRDFTLGDVEALAACRMDERYWRYYDRVDDVEATAREHVELFVRWQSETPRTHYQLAIVLKQDDTLIGDCGLRRRPQVEYGGASDLEADIGYELDPRYWRQGYATEAMRALVSFGFETLGLHRVWAFCLAANEPSWRLMERLGMHREGQLRQNAQLRGRWVETFVYGLLEDEWKSRP